MKPDAVLSPGLYDIKGTIGFLGYQTKYYARFIELYHCNAVREKSIVVRRV
jgi:hypothetical protein